ncbi:MAG: MaoC family dehydratase [Chloroflexi bacterium]|nr:MaoC family dehydratase [Chloroflexota bacterium]
MTYKPGMSANRTKTFSDEDVRLFAQLTGDTNPVHLDATYAATTVFGRRIVHGMLTSALISAVLANDLPGPGTIYLGQNLKFKKPVFIGDTITATVIISQVRAERKIVTFETTCTNQNGEVVIEGEATVKAP